MKTYCVKCREKTDSHSENIVTMKNGRHRLTGICSVCGTKKNTFVSKDGTFREKTDTERADIRKKKALAKGLKKALKVGLKTLSEK